MTTRQTLWLGWLIVAIGAAYVFTDQAVTNDPGEGRWTGKLRGDRVRIELGFASLPFSSRATFDVPLDDLQGLDRADFGSDAGERPLSFRLTRDPGTIVFEGQGGRRPSGTYAFESDPGFVRALNLVGDSFPEDRELFRLLIHDVPIALVEGLGAFGYDGLDTSEVVRVSVHGIDLDFIEAMQRLGYRPEIDDLVRLRAQGITPDFVRRLAEAGHTGLSVDELVRIKTRGLDDFLAGRSEGCN